MRAILAIVAGALVIMSVAVSAGSVRAGGHGGGSSPIWHQVGVDSKTCLYAMPYTTTYIFNEDDDGNGVNDVAIFYFESPVIRLPQENAIDYPFQMTVPNRNVNQWAMAFFGYTATGTCNDANSWIIHVASKSPYQNPNLHKPVIMMYTQLTVPVNSHLTLQDWMSHSTTVHVVTQNPWSVSSGPWTPWPLVGGLSVSNWYPSQTYQDWAYEIKAFGHPLWTMYTVASAVMSYGWTGAECPVGSGAPTAQIGLIHDTGYPNEPYPFVNGWGDLNPTDALGGFATHSCWAST